MNKYGIDFKNDLNRDRIMKVLKFHKGEEVNAWKLSFESKVLHYTDAIAQLRRIYGANIITNRLEKVDNINHSYYELHDYEEEGNEEC